MEGKDGFVRYLEVVTGYSDGLKTEILEVIGGDLPEKTPVIVGENRKKAAKLTDGIEPNNLLVMPGAATTGGVSFGSVLTLTPQDAEAILRECPAVKSVSSVVRACTQASFGNKNWVPVFIYGTDPLFLDVRDWTDLEEGSPFTEADVIKGSPGLCDRRNHQA